MALAGRTPLTLYPLEGCTFGAKAAKQPKHPTLDKRLARLEELYKQHGLRRSVEAVLLVHDHGHPHLLLLKSGGQYQLPGGRLRPGEDEVGGLYRKLTTALSPAGASHVAIDWQIGDCIATYWRPHFEPQMYPYLPVHVTRPKEVKRLYAVQLPERCYFAVPGNLKLVAIPLYECLEGAARFGAVIAALPHLLSRFRLTAVGQPPPEAPLALPAPPPQKAEEGT